MLDVAKGAGTALLFIIILRVGVEILFESGGIY